MKTKLKNPILEEDRDLKAYERHEINPFFADLALEMKLKTKYTSVKTIPADEMIVKKDTNEPVSNLSNVLIRRTYVDKSSFIKYYGTLVGMMMNLSPSAVKCFIYFTSKISYDTSFYFNYNLDYKKIGYKDKKMANNAIKELINMRLIAFSEQIYMFWMNPSVVCKGDRFALIDQFIKDDNLTPDVINENIKEQIKNRKNVITSIKQIKAESKKQPEIDFEKDNH